MGILDWWTTTIGIDAGSENIRIIKDGSLIVDEATALSIDPVSNNVSSVGNSTIQTDNVIVKPVDYVISDFHGFEFLLRDLIKKGINEKSFLPRSYRLYFSIPINVTEAEKRVYRDSAEHAGAKEVYLIHHPCAAAIGMGILFEKKDFILIDFSASKIEVTAFADSYPIAKRIVRIGTWKLKRVIRNFLYRKHNLTFSDPELEDLTRSIGSIYADKEIKILPSTVNTEELIRSLTVYFEIIEDGMLELFEEINGHPRFREILSNGVYFTGGGSLIQGIPDMICLNEKFRYTVSNTPFLDSINGLARVISNPKAYSNYLMV